MGEPPFEWGVPDQSIYFKWMEGGKHSGCLLDQKIKPGDPPILRTVWAGGPYFKGKLTILTGRQNLTS